MELYIIGGFFTMALVADKDDEDTGWKDEIKLVFMSLVWPITLGLLAGHLIDEWQKKQEETK